MPKIAIDNSATLNLSALTSGTYEGRAMYYDGRSVAMSPGCKIEGNSTSNFEGDFSFPTQRATFRHNSNLATNCIQLVPTAHLRTQYRDQQRVPDGRRRHSMPPECSWPL